MDKRTGIKPKSIRSPAYDTGKFALTSANIRPKDYPIFCLKHLVHGYTLKECDKNLRAFFASKLYNMAQQTWVALENADHKSGAGFERIPKEELKVTLPSIVTEDVAKMHVMRFNGKTGRIIGMRSEDIYHITHIEIDKTAYDHGS